MLDLETLGTKPGCKILAIGATTFGEDFRHEKQTFEIYISRPSQPYLTEDPATLAWWESQSQEAKDKVFNNPRAVTLQSALLAFSDYLGRLDGTPVVWGNAASFDCSVLEAAYDISGVAPVPWNFRNQMCFRTLKNLVTSDIAPPFNGTKHTPLDDAMYQAEYATRIMQMLRLNWD